MYTLRDKLARLHENTWTWLRRENFKRETKSILEAAQNNAMMTNYVKAEIDNM